MAAVESFRNMGPEQIQGIQHLVERQLGPEPLTTRETVTAQVATGWLALHQELDVPATTLAKTLQQLLTEVFATGHQRRREALSEHAVSLLDLIGTDATEFAPARTFAVKADMPVEYGRTFGLLAAVLTPLAAAIQLARTPVADAAEELAKRGELFALAGSTGLITRPQLRGFVVARVRPHAEALHARVGAGESTAGYLELILRDAETIAQNVVEAAVEKLWRAEILSPLGAANLERYVREHLTRLRAAAAARYGRHAEDIVGMTLCKLAAAFRNRPELSIDYAYGRVVLTSAANVYLTELAQQGEHETGATEHFECAASGDTVPTEVADLLVGHVLAVAADLADSDASAERALAGQTLLRYFLADPAVVDPRRARLAAHVLTLSPADDRGDDEVSADLHALAATLTPDRDAATRIAAMAIAALRTPPRT